LVKLTLYVEGGGDTTAQRERCREGFSEFIRKAGLQGDMPRIVSCGGRSKAYDRFRLDIESGNPAMLLVDSEDPMTTASPWTHLLQRPGDGWQMPSNATDDDCHLMVQCMESWLLADREALKAFFGQGYREKRLPAVGNPVESLSRQALQRALVEATKDCKTKASYGKGEHSFRLLARIDPQKVANACPSAARFVATLKARMGSAA